MIHKMKEMPEGERPYERCFAQGPEVLTDAELLAVILRTGSRKKNSVELAHEILALTGNDSSIAGLERLSITELQRVPGIGRVKAIQLKALSEFSRRLWKSRTKERLYFRNPEDIAAYFMEDMRYLRHEEVRVLFLDIKCRFVAEKIMTKGTLDSSLVSTRELMIEAVRAEAALFAMVHNHPSGDPEASMDDIHITQKVQMAGSIMNIKLLDSIIIGDGVYKSLRQDSRIAWDIQSAPRSGI